MRLPRLPEVLKKRLPQVLSLRLPIVGGPLKGNFWAPGARGKVLRYLTGTYEPETTQHILDCVKPGDVVFDVGANLGYLTLLFSKLVGDQGRVIAFEPAPHVARCLEEHVRCNRCTNVTVYPIALGDCQGTVRFENVAGTGRGRVIEEGGIEVDQETIDRIALKEGVAPDFIKIDVEGVGAEVLAGGQLTIARSHPAVYLSLHSGWEHNQSVEIMTSLGYTYERDEFGELIFQRSPAVQLQRAA
ncbi:MAG: FkbM family methyltransferase [Pirellulaceae bacterium]|jgi:FkbM family methyltransferase|nr:FkbM family methyltransferase [Pirellulaceae bacterium]